MEEEAGKPIHPTCVEVETTTDENGDNVQVYYLDVPGSEDSQVLDISNITNILSQEGIQIVESDGGLTEVATGDGQSAKAYHQNVILEVDADGTICRDQSATQSAEALLNLAKSHGGQTHQAMKVMDLLDVNNQAVTEGDLVETEQISEPVTATYVLDETGTMVPFSEYRETHGTTNILEVEGTGAQTVAACACWCGKDFFTNEELEKHQLTHSKRKLRGTAQLKCELCSEIFNTSSKLASHHRVAHPDGMPWECPVCFRRFSKKLGLKVHLRAHSGLKQHKCSYCDRSFSYKNALLRHIRLHTKDKPYKCTICGEAFAHMWAMRRHRAIHKPKHVYQCDICSKTFKQKTTLYVHARIHTGQRPYSCEICRKSFTLKSSLNQHLRIHTGERPKVCPICGKAFRQTSTLRSHMNLHSHIKPHKCRYCKKRFTTVEEAKEHEGIHMNNKSWQCEECGMRFRNQSLLARHVRKHTNERPFQCKVCGKSFTQSGSLQSHMRTHTKEKPYQCRLCPKTYTTSGTLLLHIRKAHGLDAKSVKDVFPNTHYVEDQKVFTIPTPLRNSATINTSVSGGEDGNDSVMSEVLGREGLVFEEVVDGAQGDGGLTHEEAEMIIQRIKPLSKDSSGQQNPNKAGQIEGNAEEELDDSKGNASDVSEEKKRGVNKNLNVKDLMRKRQIRPGSLTLMNVDSGQYKIIDTEKENSLYAQARQEAALGLAELSLVGGVVVSEKRPGTAYRTLARGGSDMDSSDDPSVTKIILSKEGGVMNSQDPHQCPDCKRIFGRKSIMVEHRRIHTDEKPYKCDFCSGEFRQSAQLTCHILNKHTKEKLYHCTFCQKKFLSRSITVRHINFHHKLKLRVCESMCPGWKIDDAIYVEKKELIASGLLQTSTKGTNKKNLKIGKKSDITILNSLAGLGSPTVKVKFGTDKKKVAIKTSHNVPDNVPPTIEYCATPSAETEAEEQQMIIKTEEPDTHEGLEEAQDTVIGTWYVCETCAMQFNTMGSLRWHLRQVHNTTLAESDVSYVFEDEPAGNVTKEPSMLQAPVTSALEESLAKLEAEDEVDETESKLEIEQEKSTTFVVVSKRESENNESIMSVSSDIEEADHTITIGKQDPPTSYNIKTTLRCSLCAVYFGSRLELEQHLMTHNNEEVALAGLHRCDMCGVVMKNTQQITKHILKVHGAENIYGCSICDKEFFQESSVLRHIKFFHKWEMKIRGEGNIPVLLKPASEHLKIPGAGDKNKVKGKVREVPKDVDVLGKKSPKSDVKVTSRYENDMTFISLEVGDLDHLQLYREDGQEVRFEVVSSTEKSTVIRIKDPQRPDGDDIPISIEDAETTIDNMSQEQSIEVIHAKEEDADDNVIVLNKGCEDSKVTVGESPPSKVVVNEELKFLPEPEEIDRTPKVVVVKEKGVIPAMQETGQVIEDGFCKQNETIEQSSPDIKILYPLKAPKEKNVPGVKIIAPGKAQDEKKEEKTIMDVDNVIETDKATIPPLDVSGATQESMEIETKVNNTSTSSPVKSTISNDTIVHVSPNKDSNLEVRVVEKSKKNMVPTTSDDANTPTTDKQASKVRTISVLNKSPSDIVNNNSGDSKTSPTKKQIIEKVNTSTRNSPRNLGSSKIANIGTKSAKDDNDDTDSQPRSKRGKSSKDTLSNTPVQQPEKSKASPSTVSTPKPQTVSKLKHDPVDKATPKTTTAKQNEQPVSQSRSGRVIKRKRFADEEFETTPRKHPK